MTATAITSADWLRRLDALTRPSSDGTELSVIRNDAGITIYTVHGDALSVYAVCRSIGHAYDMIRAALARNPGHGFYVV